MPENTRPMPFVTSDSWNSSNAPETSAPDISGAIPRPKNGDTYRRASHFSESSDTSTIPGSLDWFLAEIRDLWPRARLTPRQVEACSNWAKWHGRTHWGNVRVALNNTRAMSPETMDPPWDVFRKQLAMFLVDRNDPAANYRFMWVQWLADMRKEYGDTVVGMSDDELLEHNLQRCRAVMSERRKTNPGLFGLVANELQPLTKWDAPRIPMSPALRTALELFR